MGSANLEYPFLKLRRGQFDRVRSSACIHLREKITHFDHERIPERIVHARGAAAHGVFESYGTAKSVTKAGFLGKTGTKTDVFTRFSTMLGSRGSADTVRDTRGFAVKFECSAQLR
jgi:catalase